ncbi:MAG TPA: tetratricopeptide repeat protein [Syntrophorhabdaceae bacterium]|nr:tetratricopeptide repeat protein [Syntrophorhabdaceae bacterium]
MKKKNKRVKTKKKSPGIISKSTDRSAHFTDGDSYYFYNLGMLLGERKKTIVQVGRDKKFFDALEKGLKAANRSGIVFYCVDPDSVNETLNTGNNQGIFNSVEYISLSAVDCAKRFEDKSIDVIFLKGGYDFYNLYDVIDAWYPKLKDSGWLSGYCLFYDEGNLERFAGEKGLGFSILKRPLTDNIFELYPEDIVSGLKKIQDYLNCGMLLDADQVINRIITAYPHSPFLTNLKAELDYRCGKTLEAKKQFERIIDMWPYHVRAMNNLGAIEANTGYPKKARALFEKVLEIDPGNEDAIASLDEMGRLGL